MALMDNLLNAATQVLGGNSENGAQGSLTDMAMDLVKQQGGVGNLINQLQQGGLGDTLSSWVSNQSSNLPVSGSDLQNALGSDTVNQIAQKFGVDAGQAGDLLAKVLPDFQQPQTAPQTAYEPEKGQVLTMVGQSPQNLMYDGYVEAGQQFAQRGGVVGSP